MIYEKNHDYSSYRFVEILFDPSIYASYSSKTIGADLVFSFSPFIRVLRISLMEVMRNKDNKRLVKTKHKESVSS